MRSKGHSQNNYNSHNSHQNSHNSHQDSHNNNSHDSGHGSQGHGDSHGDQGSSLINLSLLNGIGNGNSIGNGNDISIPLLNGTKVGIGDVLSDNLHIYDSNIGNVLFDDVIGKAGIGLDALASVQHVLDGTALFDLPDLFDHFG